MVLLCLRSTLTDTNLLSPAHILYSRQPRTNLPSLSIHTRDRETARKFLQSQRQRVRTEYYNGVPRTPPPPSVPPRLTPTSQLLPRSSIPNSLERISHLCPTTPETAKLQENSSNLKGNEFGRRANFSSPAQILHFRQPRLCPTTPKTTKLQGHSSNLGKEFRKSTTTGGPRTSTPPPAPTSLPSTVDNGPRSITTTAPGHPSQSS